MCRKQKTNHEHNTNFNPIAHYHTFIETHLDILNDPSVHRLLEPIIGITRKRLLIPIRRFGTLPMATRPLTIRIGLLELLLHTHRLIGRRQEDDLAIGGLGHGLHSLQIPNLHRGRRAQDVSRLPHQFGTFHLGSGGDDFGFSDPFGLGGHGEGVLQFGAEDYVFDEHGFDLDAPA